MRRKKLVLTLTAAVLAALGILFALRHIGGAESLQPGAETTAPMQTEPAVTFNPYTNGHYFFNTINRGDCRRLQGKVLLVFFLVSDEQSRWDALSVQKLKQAHSNTTKVMTMEAAAYGVELTVEHKYIHCAIGGTLDRDDYPTRVREALENGGYPNSAKASRKLRQEYGADSAAILFCVNRADRSFCLPNTNVSGFEYAVLYGKTEDYRHELYHLYGAKDLYLASVKHFGEKYFPTSVMMDSRLVVDELTAYLIGWMDSPTEKVLAFLEDTKHINASNFKGEYD